MSIVGGLILLVNMGPGMCLLNINHYVLFCADYSSSFRRRSLGRWKEEDFLTAKISTKRQWENMGSDSSSFSSFTFALVFYGIQSRHYLTGRRSWASSESAVHMILCLGQKIANMGRHARSYSDSKRKCIHIFGKWLICISAPSWDFGAKSKLVRPRYKNTYRKNLGWKFGLLRS